MEKRLYKINRGKIMDGVCGGISERTLGMVIRSRFESGF